ncbi:hypothetical protein AAC387_Pa01g2044 [Persea americana]
MEERAKEEDKGLELMKQEESRFEGKRNKTKQREEKEEKEQDLPLLPVGSCPPSEDDAEEFYMVKGVTSIQLCVGMEFESEEAARKFYNGYARRVGFSIRASDFYRSKRTGEITSRRFVCARQGFHKRKDTLKHPRTSNREGCKAFMHVKRRDSGRWVVVRAVKEHNHDLMSVRKLHSLGSRRHLYDTAKSLIDSFEGVEEASSHSSPVPSEIFCGTNRNYGSNIRSDRPRNLGREFQTLLEYLKTKQAERPAFFYAIQVDEGQCMRNVFWVDARSRMAYKYFHDVVTLGMEFKRNLSELSFVSFTGLNHHEQTTFFGCALLSDDSESSFVWLFNTWLAAMSGRHPKALVTSQDKSILAAVAQVLPKTRHCLDKWDILCEVADKLAHVHKAHQSFEGELHKCINMNGTVGEFESSWEFLLNRYNLKDNDLLRSLYDVRRQWVPVYLRDTFFAGMSMLERSGIPDSFFVGYVNAQATLQEFIGQYEKCLDTQYEKEVVADFETIHTKPFLKTASPIEKQAANIYTKEIFTKFQEELFETCAYTAHRYEEDGALSMYRVARFGEDHEACTVTFNTSKLQASCSCRMFEFSGILCRHLLTVFRVANVLSLPSHCFLKRWTRNAKSGTTLDDQATDLEGNCCSSLTGLTLRYNNLCQEAIKLAEEGAVSMDIYDVAVHALREALDKVLAAKNIVVNAMHDDEDSLFCGSFREDDVSGESREENAAEHTKSCVPRLSKAEGRPLASKLKPGREKNSRKIRMCNI